MTRAKAIAAKCKECIYDELDQGTWRQQVKACDIESCALHPYRPMPYKPRRQAVQRDSEVIGSTVGPDKGSGITPHNQPVRCDS